jgi:hypothetical protein
MTGCCGLHSMRGIDRRLIFVRMPCGSGCKPDIRCGGRRGRNCDGCRYIAMARRYCGRTVWRGLFMQSLPAHLRDSKYYGWNGWKGMETVVSDCIFLRKESSGRVSYTLIGVKIDDMHPIMMILDAMANDDRIGPAHVCLYLAIWDSSERLGTKGSFYVCRRKLMRLSKLKGRTTYSRVIGELARWHYIDYRPSPDLRGRSRVRVMGI